MGNEVAQEVKSDPNFTILCGVDAHPNESLPFPIHPDFDFCPSCQCVIDFSSPQLLRSLLDYALKSHTPVVLASTGYSISDVELIRAASEKIPVFVSENLSRGMQKMRKLVREASSLPLEEFDTEIIEAHHRGKKDAPSGTAKMLARTICLARDGAPCRILCGRREGFSPRLTGDIGVSSVRAGGIFGEHTVLFASEDEVLEVRHTALSRRCFAKGALEAAAFLVRQSSGLFSELSNQ